MSYKVKLRDRLAESICNFTMDHIASRDYERYVWTICAMGSEQFHAEFEKLVEEAIPQPQATPQPRRVRSAERWGRKHRTSPGGPAGYG